MRSFFPAASWLLRVWSVAISASFRSDKRVMQPVMPATAAVIAWPVASPSAGRPADGPIPLGGWK